MARRAVALVTGGGSGIGRAVACRLADDGALVVVAGRNPEALRQTAELIEQGDCRICPADVSSEAEVRALVHGIVDEHGRLDVAVNSAGLPSWGLTAELDAAEWDAVTRTNLTALWLCMKYELTAMMAQHGGAIVNVCSRIGAHMRVPMQGAYAASKAGASALTRSAAREYIRYGIRVNAVSPGPTDTGMSTWPGETAADRDRRIERDVPVGRLARPSEVAAAVSWLASAEASFVVGHDLVVDGGMSA